MRVREVGLQLDRARERRSPPCPSRWPCRPRARVDSARTGCRRRLRRRGAPVRWRGRHRWRSALQPDSPIKPPRRLLARAQPRQFRRPRDRSDSSFISDCAARYVDAGSPSRAASTACSYEPDWNSRCTSGFCSAADTDEPDSANTAANDENRPLLSAVHSHRGTPAFYCCNGLCRGRYTGYQARPPVTPELDRSCRRPDLEPLNPREVRK